MLKFIYTASTLAFDSFGDIVLEHGDLKVKTDRRDVALQAITDYLKTTSGDYFFNQSLGANYDRYIGMGITNQLVKEVTQKIKDDIILLQLLPQSLFEVYGLQHENSIQIRIILFEDEDYTIYANFDPSIGVSIGY